MAVPLASVTPSAWVPPVATGHHLPVGLSFSDTLSVLSAVHVASLHALIVTGSRWQVSPVPLCSMRMWSNDVGQLRAVPFQLRPAFWLA